MIFPLIDQLSLNKLNGTDFLRSRSESGLYSLLERIRRSVSLDDLILLISEGWMPKLTTSTRKRFRYGKIK